MSGSTFHSAFAGAIFALAVAGPVSACNTAAWDQISGTAIEARPQAAYEGLCGLRVTLGGGGANWVEDQTPGGFSPAVGQYAARFYLHAGDAVLPEGAALTLMQALDAAQAELFAVELRGSRTGKRLSVRARSGSGTSSSGVIDLPSGWRAVEARWLTGSGNGSLTLALDGEDRLALPSLDNGSLAVGRTRLGLVSGAAAAQSGWLDFDAFASRRSGSNGLVEKPCSGTAVTITGTTFLPGDHTCVGTASLTTGNRVTVDPGARLTLTAPRVVLGAGTAIALGAQLSVTQP